MFVNEIYVFEKSKTNKSKYLLTKASANAGVIPLPIEKKSGRAYIEFMENIQKKSKHSNRVFNYGFYLGVMNGKHKRLTGVNFDSACIENDRVCAGDTLSLGRRDLLLFDFSNDGLTMYVIYNEMANKQFYLSLYKTTESIFCKGFETVV